MEKKEVTKTPKAPKTVSMKKLPGLLKKSYTPEKFEKKILNKIYIPEDREFVKGYFKADKDKKGNVCIPRDTRIDRTDFKFLKGISKEVKAQKFGIKLVPLFAVICFIAAIWITYALFRNVIARKIIVNYKELTWRLLATDTLSQRTQARLALAISGSILQLEISTSAILPI